MRGLEQIPWLYDAIMVLFERLGLGRFRRHLVAGARGLTLELGCGTGRNLPLYSRPRKLLAVDVDLRLLRRARARSPQAVLVLARAEALPFRASCLDTVVSSLVFCSVPDPLRGLAEVRRVLRPQAHLLMLEHVRAASCWAAQLQDLLQPTWTCLTGGCHPNRDTESLVEQAGFEIAAATRRAHGLLRCFAASSGLPRAGGEGVNPPGSRGYDDRTSPEHGHSPSPPR